MNHNNSSILKKIKKLFYHRYLKLRFNFIHLQLNGLLLFTIGAIFGLYVLTSNYLIPYILGLGEVSTEWNFSNAGDYSLSSSSFLEVSDNSVKFKSQEYEQDDNTIALYHFNESSGDIVSDSSQNNNTGELTDGDWISGKLNNALTLNGSTSHVSVPDSTSLSFVQSNTLEAWTKFDSNFSANSHNNKQYIFDKGQYQLYYDHDTGKIVYELARSNANTWTIRGGDKVNNSWENDAIASVDSMATDGTNIYYGLGNDDGDAEVWSWDGSSWTKIGGDGVNSSWVDATYEVVESLLWEGSYLYAGLGDGSYKGEVWRWNGTIWEQIGGDGLNSGFGVNSYSTGIEVVRSMIIYQGKLTVGLGSGGSDSEIWVWDGVSSWSQLANETINGAWPASDYSGVWSMVTDGTNLYAGTGSSSSDADLWKYDGESWSKFAGDGTGWANSTYEITYSLATIGSDLYVGLGTGGNDADVFKWNGETWTQIGGDSTKEGWTTNFDSVLSLVPSGSDLYAMLGTSNGEAEVWKYHGSGELADKWRRVGGDGDNGSWSGNYSRTTSLVVMGDELYVGLNGPASGEAWHFNGSTWTKIGGNYTNYSWGFSGIGSVQSSAVFNNKLYVGTYGSTAGAALVFEYDESNWSLIGGQKIKNSWTADTFESVYSLVVHRGKLYAALGYSTIDAEVWEYDGTSWLKVGGQELNESWGNEFESVLSLASDGVYLYAGLGTGGRDAEVWRRDPQSGNWERIGNDTDNGWTSGDYIEVVESLFVHAGKLYAGTGNGNGDADLWQWVDPSWTKIGGDGINDSWPASIYNNVEVISVYDNEIYIGTSNGSAGEAELWRWNGSDTWTQIGGDGMNNSWVESIYESVLGLVTYNGLLYAALGTSGNDAEVWEYDGTNWVQIGGISDSNSSINSSWGNNYEVVSTMTVYKGKLYVGLGNSSNADAEVWSYGNNAVLQSVADSQNNNWHHIAATYNGETMKLYIDGVEDNSLDVSLSMLDNDKSLLIGSNYGNTSSTSKKGYFDGLIDEARISNTSRSSFNTSTYANTPQTVQLSSAAFTGYSALNPGIQSYYSFSTSDNDTGTIAFRLSSDGGNTWKYWDGDSWSVSDSVNNINDSATINSHIDEFPVTTGGLKWQAVLTGNGDEEVTLNSVSITATPDATVPTNPSSITALNASGGEIELTSGNWYSYTTPYFSWTGANDEGESGIDGYWVYFGSDDSAVPLTTGAFQTNSSYTATNVSSGTYYLRIQTRDIAQRLSETYTAFTYQIDNSAPTNPSLVSVSPAGYTASNSYTFFWPSSGESAAQDLGSDVAGYQYKTGATSEQYSDWSDTITETSVTLADAAYTEGSNIFYLRTVDNVGLISSSSIQVNYYFSGSAPTAVRNLEVTPETNTTNSFAFSWDIPESFTGEVSGLTYCYTVNTLPLESTCTFTQAGITSLSADAFATQPRLNTLYVVAKDSLDNIQYDSSASVAFYANTSAPGIPQNLNIADVSVKETSSWKLAVSWEPPTDTGAGISSYKVYRSIDETSYTLFATTSGKAYVDTGLEQKTHYYKIKACDSVNNCGADSAVIYLYPNGKYTTAPSLVSGPIVSNTTTKKATITWSTGRDSDSKVQYGLNPDDYYEEEPSNSKQTTDHSITLNSLVPGTTYYYRSKWTDDDGNTGTSEEKSFTTDNAPTVKNVSATNIGLTSALIKFTAEGASKSKIYYGKTTSFGGAIDLSTSTSESDYTTQIADLEDGTKYYYKINTFDSENDEYEGTILDFNTLPRPKISEVRIQQVSNTAQSTILVSWNTNTETSSIVTYYPVGQPEGARDEVNITLIKGEHKAIVRGLFSDTNYNLIVKGRDRLGNEASSDRHSFTTATDTRPPQISGLKVESTNIPAISGTGQEVTSQLVVSWNTDEPATSQVEFGEGTGSTYAQKTQEDGNLTHNHIVIVSNLTPSKVYHFRAISKDKASNTGHSIDTVTITPKATENALNLVITNIQEAFGLIRGLTR